MNLDDDEGFGKLDTAGALDDIAGTAEQWKSARSAAPPPADLRNVDAVVLAGVGGSGVCGDFVGALAADRLPVPVIVHKGYGLPAYVGPTTLVVAVSCSGDTEETCSAAEEARRRGARLVLVTSGGTLGSLCAAEDVVGIRVGRAGQPRHSLGHLAVPVLALLGLDDALDEAIAAQQEMTGRCGPTVPLERNPAKRLASRLADDDGLPAVYGTAGLAAVAAYRLKCQLNENAKMPVLAGALPEVTHNEIAGWTHAAPASGVLVTIRDHTGEDPRAGRRLTALVDELGDRFSWTEELVAEPGAPLARLAGLILQADLVSVYAALARDRDPTPIAAVDRVKGARSQ